MRVNKYNKVQTDKTNMRRIAIYLLCIFMLLPVATMTAQPGYNYSKLQREKLNRGVVAIRENPSEVIVSWRYLSSDPIQTGFNVYRDGKKLTDTPITVSTLFRDKNNSQKTAVYEVRPVLKGKETHHIDGTYTFPENVCSTPCGPLLSMHFPRTLRKIRKLYAGFKISGLPDRLHK